MNAVLFHADHLSGIGGVRRPGIVHRLDKGTSGLLVVAKSDRAHQGLAAQFADHSAGRRYLALCYAAPVLASGTIRSELGRHPYHRLRYASVESGGKPACTHWRVLARGERNSLIECRLETGRTHQVRVHLCESGWPLAGDPLYRRRAAQPTSALRPYLSEERPLLHAWHLSFIHPTDGQPRQLSERCQRTLRRLLGPLGCMKGSRRVPRLGTGQSTARSMVSFRTPSLPPTMSRHSTAPSLHAIQVSPMKVASEHVSLPRGYRGGVYPRPVNLILTTLNDAWRRSPRWLARLWPDGKVHVARACTKHRVLRKIPGTR